MMWINPYLLAEMHRETYVAILKSWIPHGEKGNFADRVGITREYLSYLCALDRPAEDKSPPKRLPSPQMAKKIAEALPAPPEIRRSLYENMELAHVNAVRARYKSREFIAQRQVSDLLDGLKLLHRQATFGTDLPEVQRDYRALRDAAASLVTRLSFEIYPTSLAQACLYLHDAQCVLDRSDDALRHAKLARLVLENADILEEGFNREDVDYMEINAIRGEGVALHNLGLDREAQWFYARARTTPAYRNSRDFWEPFVGRDILNAMARTPRFSIRKAKNEAQEIMDVCERKGDEFTHFLSRESWLRCLIQREKWKRAQRVFQEETERIPRLAYIGSLHRALLLKSGALLAWKMKDEISWQERITQLLKLLNEAGLKHQMHTVQKYYGPALKPVLESLGFFTE
jgi:hypothetical protein